MCDILTFGLITLILCGCKWPQKHLLRKRKNEINENAIENVANLKAYLHVFLKINNTFYIMSSHNHNNVAQMLTSSLKNWADMDDSDKAYISLYPRLVRLLADLNVLPFLPTFKDGHDVVTNRITLLRRQYYFGNLIFRHYFLTLLY